MTWVIAIPAPGFAALIADTRVTTRMSDGTRVPDLTQPLRKIFRVGNRIGFGYAGNVNIGLALLESFRRRIESCHDPGLPLIKVMEEWSRRAWTESLYRAVRDREFDQDVASALIVNISDNLWGPIGSSLVWTECVKVETPSRPGDPLTLTEMPFMQASGIGSGQEVPEYRTILQEFDAPMLLRHASPPNADFTAVVLGEIISRGIDEALSANTVSADLLVVVLSPQDALTRSNVGHPEGRWYPIELPVNEGKPWPPPLTDILGDSLCPCGSRRSFPECCLPEATRRQEQFNFPWLMFEDDFATRELRISDARFGRYYAAKRGQIRMDLFWARDITLPTGVPTLATRIDNSITVVRARCLPIPFNQGLSTAKELESSLLHDEGFPSTTARSLDQIGRLSSALNGMLWNPLITRRLTEYGWDLGADYVERSQNALRRVAGIGSPLADSDVPDLVRSQWTFALVNYVLCFDVISEHYPTIEDEFVPWFESEFPAISQDARLLATYCRETGYDTPGQMRTVFETVIDGCPLPEDIALP